MNDTRTRLSDFSQDLSALVAEASRSIVAVDARRSPAASGIAFAEDLVVTSSHAVEREEGIRVGRPDGKVVDAKLRGRDPTTDLAVLETDATGLAAPAWSDGEGLALGQLVVAVGRPGNTPAATLGIVSVLDDAWRTHGGGKIDRWLEADLALPRGLSGSLLVDTAGRGLGLNTTGLVRGRSVTIPASTLRRVVDALASRGQVERGFLGITSQPIRLPEKLAASTGQAAALIIVGVQPGGPSEGAGVLIGDVLLGLDGQATTDVGELVGLLEAERIGKPAKLRLLRAGQLAELEVTVGARSWS